MSGPNYCETCPIRPLCMAEAGWVLGVRFNGKIRLLEAPNRVLKECQIDGLAAARARGTFVEVLQQCSQESLPLRVTFR